MLCCGLAGPAVYQDRISKQSSEVTATYCSSPQQCNARPTTRTRDCPCYGFKTADIASRIREYQKHPEIDDVPLYRVLVQSLNMNLRSLQR
jgi:hypothetical protein